MKSRRRRVLLLFFAVCAAFIAVLATRPRLVSRIPGGDAIKLKVQGKATVADRLEEVGPAARQRWKPFFARAGVAYPPHRLVLAAFKQEKKLEVYAAGADGVLRFVRALPVLAASGKVGPKLQYGDYQVPEGFYRIEALNPNSRFHLALRVNYPNAFDRAEAARGGRTHLGGDIMIHGSNASVGCLAMGDVVSEDLFVLAAQTGREKIELLICPVDFREHPPPAPARVPKWMEPVYARLEERLAQLPVPSG